MMTAKEAHAATQEVIAQKYEREMWAPIEASINEAIKQGKTEAIYTNQAYFRSDPTYAINKLVQLGYKVRFIRLYYSADEDQYHISW